MRCQPDLSGIGFSDAALEQEVAHRVGAIDLGAQG